MLSLQNLQAKIGGITRKARESGLKSSTKKPQNMKMDNRLEATIKLNGEEVEDVDEFMYLDKNYNHRR